MLGGGGGGRGGGGGGVSIERACFIYRNLLGKKFWNVSAMMLFQNVRDF
jgi:hypothetical protein